MTERKRPMTREELVDMEFDDDEPPTREDYERVRRLDPLPVLNCPKAEPKPNAECRFPPMLPKPPEPFLPTVRSEAFLSGFFIALMLACAVVVFS
jgi:hypothetical protein